MNDCNVRHFPSPGVRDRAVLRGQPCTLEPAPDIVPVAAAPRRRRRPVVVMLRAEAPSGRSEGFSLLELLVVVAILGILVAAALPRFAEFRAAAYDSRSQQDLRNLAAAEELYRATSPTYAGDTTSLKGFAASEGVNVALETADENSFVATATHPAGSRDFRWDSSSDPPLSSTPH